MIRNVKYKNLRENMYIYEQDLALNNQQQLICNKNRTNQTSRMWQCQFLSKIHQVSLQFSFWSGWLSCVKEPSLPCYLAIARRKIVGFITVLCEMQTALSRIWTLAAESISYNNNHYTLSYASIMRIWLIYRCTFAP